MTIVQWFNPLVWLYRNSIKSIHEYLADEGVLVKGFDAVDYQNLLLHQSMGIQVNELTNNFNHSLIKTASPTIIPTPDTSRWTREPVNPCIKPLSAA